MTTDAERLAEANSLVDRCVHGDGFIRGDAGIQIAKALAERDATIACLTKERDEARDVLTFFRDLGCPICSGDCASANPPVNYCPMQRKIQSMFEDDKKSEKQTVLKGQARESKEATHHQRFYTAFYDWFVRGGCDFWSECNAPEELATIAAELSDTFAANAVTKAINTPETTDFLTGVAIETKHQRERWGETHDRSKAAEDWYWLVGYLAGKALRAHVDGDIEKARHHTISSATVLFQWHSAIGADRRSAEPTQPSTNEEARPQRDTTIACLTKERDTLSHQLESARFNGETAWKVAMAYQKVYEEACRSTMSRIASVISECPVCSGDCRCPIASQNTTQPSTDDEREVLPAAESIAAPLTDEELHALTIELITILIRRKAAV